MKHAFLTNFFKVMEIIQYVVLYSLFILPFIIVEDFFPKENKEKNTIKILIEVILQILILSIFILIVKWIIKKIPFVFKNFVDYKEFEVYGNVGTIVVALILFGTQRNLRDKLTILRRRLLDYVDEKLWFYSIREPDKQKKYII